jgi:hypothetical protein
LGIRVDTYGSADVGFGLSAHRGNVPVFAGAIGRNFAGLPEADVYKLVVGNAADLYNFN